MMEPIAEAPMTFDSLNLVADGWRQVVNIDGQSWTASYFGKEYGGSMREIRRQVPAGDAVISERGDGTFWMIISLPNVVRGEIKNGQPFPSLKEAAAVAESYAWEIVEHAGNRWYRSRSSWSAILGDGDIATIAQYENDPKFYMKRNISPRHGENYEMTATRYDLGESDKHAVTTFAEAAAIAVTLPAFLAALGSKQVNCAALEKPNK